MLQLGLVYKAQPGSLPLRLAHLHCSMHVRHERLSLYIRGTQRCSPAFSKDRSLSLGVPPCDRV